MIHIALDGMNLKIETQEWGFYEALKEGLSAYAENYRFSPKYQSGTWDGKISMFRHKKVPYGLLTDVLRIYKEDYKHIPLTVDSEVQALFRTGLPVSEATGLKWDPADHQADCIVSCLQYSKGIIRLATGGGKSLIMAYVAKNLIENKLIKRQIIIVPNKTLITQLYENFLEYGFPAKALGKVYGDEKDWNKHVVISTWQTLSKNHDKLTMYDSVFVDEVQHAKSKEIKEILEKCEHAKYRLGFTGTMHDEKLDQWNVRAFLGPVLQDISAEYLQSIGWLAQCTINVVNINYKKELPKKMDYHEVKDTIFRNPFRLHKIRSIIASVKKGTVLLLVGKVEDEGQFLKEYLEQYFTDREIEFVSGDTKVKDREYWRKRCNSNKKIILIATYPIFQAGVDIPALANIIFAAPFKSKIRVLQSIGRALRKHVSKDGAVIWDLVDLGNKYTPEYGRIRQKFYYSEKFDVVESDITES